MTDNNDKIAKRVAARVIQAMAWKREDFKNRVEEHLSGAILEFYKARVAEKNGHTKWVRHWRTEVKSLLERTLVAALVHDIRGFKDRRKAFDQVVASVKEKDRTFRTIAVNQVTRDFGVPRLKVGLSDEDAVAFWAWVERATESVFKTGHA